MPPSLPLCVSVPVLLGNFNSYFELLIAFTFAYAGFKGFKEYINKVSFPDYDIVLREVSGDQSRALYAALEMTNRNFAKQKEDFERIARISLGFLQGNYLQPMFFLVGLQYIVFLILGGFQLQMGTLTVFMVVSMVCTATFLYYLFVYFKLRSHARKEIPIEEKRWLSAYWVLPIFGVIDLAIVISSVYFSAVLHRQEYFNDDPIFVGTVFCCGTKQFYESIAILMAILISVFPYAIYRLREWLFVSSLYLSLEEKRKTATQQLEEVSRMLSVIKPDDENP